MKKNILDESFYNDIACKYLIELLESEKDYFSDSSVFYKFPTIRELDEEAKMPSLLLASPTYGIVIFNCNPTISFRDTRKLEGINDELIWMEDYIFSKILKSSNKRFKKGRRDLAFNVSSVLFLPNIENKDALDIDNFIITNKGELLEYFDDIKKSYDKVENDILEEALAIIEGSIAIIKPKERFIENNEVITKAYILNKLEEEIAKFDDMQKYAALSQIRGPQRIRGLAGSGKTIILCMKAAILHLRYPEKKILYTFMTKSLYDYVEKLITRFYKVLGDGSVPDLEKSINIRHAWGGESVKGVYYETCKREGLEPISFQDAARRVGRANAFDYICRSILLEKNAELKKEYDYVLIDEGQDFGADFYKLCRAIVKDDCIIWGYDDLQNIFNVKIQDTESIFSDEELNLKGINLVDLQKFHPDMDNDIVLSRSYRNLKEILVLAHAIGLGIYNDELIQSLENDAHWNDLGYSIIEGTCKNNERVVIDRPDDNSPLILDLKKDIEEIIKVYSADRVKNELIFVAEEIEKAIKVDKLRPDDIMVICLDDRSAKSYFATLSTFLYSKDIYTHNLSANSYEKGFLEDNCVTLTTVYKAKGNEAAMVFLVGCDVFENQKNNIQMRNKIFTAITRAKAWIRLTGCDIEGESLWNEIETIKSKNFILDFIYKDENMIKRDLNEIHTKKAILRNLLTDTMIKLKKDGYSQKEIDEELKKLGY